MKRNSRQNNILNNKKINQIYILKKLNKLSKKIVWKKLWIN